MPQGCQYTKVSGDIGGTADHAEHSAAHSQPFAAAKLCCSRFLAGLMEAQAGSASVQPASHRGPS